MMQLHPCCLNFHQFTISDDKRQFVADASKLGLELGKLPGGRLYEVHLDWGITLVTPIFGTTTHWHIAEEKTEGDVISMWTFYPTKETLQMYPQINGWEVYILNK